jgi:hypothetical protein
LICFKGALNTAYFHENSEKTSRCSLVNGKTWLNPQLRASHLIGHSKLSISIPSVVFFLFDTESMTIPNKQDPHVEAVVLASARLCQEIYKRISRDTFLGPSRASPAPPSKRDRARRRVKHEYTIERCDTGDSEGTSMSTQAFKICLYG